MPQIQIFWSFRLARGRLARSPGLCSYRLSGSLRFFGQFHWRLRSLNCCRNRHGRGRGRGSDMCSRRFCLSWSLGSFRCGNGRCCGRRRCRGWCSDGRFHLRWRCYCFGRCNMWYCRFRGSGFLLQAQEVQVQGVEIHKCATADDDQDTDKQQRFLYRAHVLPFPRKIHISINIGPIDIS